MALIMVKIPRVLRGRLTPEDCFYKHFPKLKRVPLKKFFTVYDLAATLGIIPDFARNYLITSKSVHGIDYEDQILIHPQEVTRRVKERFKNLLKKQIKKSNAPPLFNPVISKLN